MNIVMRIVIKVKFEKKICIDYIVRVFHYRDEI